MATLLEYKCPSCGGALHFESDVQMLKCPYCDTEFSVEALHELQDLESGMPQEEMIWQEQPQSQWQEGEEAQLRSYVCNSCGGEILCESTTSATACPYCDNPVVMAEQVKGVLRPDLVIPFQLDKEAAVAALQKHLCGKRLLPKIFKKENKIREVKGIYVPFWLFDAQADADIRYRATRTRFWSDSKYNYTQTSHYSIHRAGSLQFIDVPVDGSTKMDDTLMESLEPFDMSKAVDFQTAYLAGYLADRYDVDAENSKGRANQRIKTSTESAFAGTVMGYQSVTPVSSNIRLDSSRVKYALLPVWLLLTRYKGEDYMFAMNGQTGKFIGNLPTDWGKFWRWWGGIALGSGALTYLIAWLVHML